MAYTPEQFKKLPKWAQDEITLQTNNAKYWKEQASLVTDHKSKIALVYPGTALRSEEVHIPDETGINFYMGDHWGDAISIRLKEIYVNGMNKVKAIHVMAGSNGLHVMPQASNVVNIYQDYPILRNKD